MLRPQVKKAKTTQPAKRRPFIIKLPSLRNRNKEKRELMQRLRVIKADFAKSARQEKKIA